MGSVKALGVYEALFEQFERWRTCSPVVQKAGLACKNLLRAGATAAEADVPDS